MKIFFQKARNELTAKVKQLGPFHLFFTLSCAEMLWSEVFISILRKMGHKISFKKDENGCWSGRDEDILVNDESPIWDFIDGMNESKHDLLKQHTFLVTRHFDERVKAFTKNIIMGPGKKVPIKYYNYRVEFQARGKITIITLPLNRCNLFLYFII